ncbi:Cullin repeat-like-containing domain protein [Suillus occidentalis]|nr:Cullin repeat-like-containing domain protein [Suillus occidentalis]
MDDDSAEIELLNKTHRISQRMTSFLITFDTRLVKFEKSILPLYNSTQKLKQRAHNVGRDLLKTYEVASSWPQPGQLEAYIDILERLNAAIAFKSSGADSRDMTGAKKLTQLCSKLVAEGSSGSPLVLGLAFILTEFPPPLMSPLTPLVVLRRILPLLSTHPSHSATSAILNTLKYAQRGYADMRQSWSRKALETCPRRVVDRAETLDGVAAGKKFSIWIYNLLKATEAEYTLLAELVPLSSNTLITGNELRDGLNVIRGVCFGSFPKFSADLNVGLADITISTVQYLNHISDVQDAVGPKWATGNNNDVINTLIGILTTLSRTQHRPPFGSVFFLNNVSYLASHLVLRPTNPNTPSLLSKPTTDFLTSSWRTAKAGYFDASFSPLMQALADDTRDKTSGSGWKAAAKEEFTLLEEDSEERSAVWEEVLKPVVPSLQWFTQKQKEKEFSKSSSAHAPGCHSDTP